MDALQAGYPRFVFHPSVRALMRWAYRVTATTHAPVGVTTAGASVHVDDASDSGHVSDAATIIGDDSPPVLLFMRRRPADACRDYITAARIPPSLGIAINTADDAVRVVELDVGDGTPQSIDVTSIATLYVVVFPHALAAVAKQFWQHAGEGLSSRAAEFVLERVGVAVAATTATNAKVAPVATTTTGTAVLASATATATSDTAIYVEERFGRNMERSQGALAKAIIKERLGEAFYGEAMTTMSSTSSASTHSPRDDYPIWLYPSGMSAIYNAHRLVREALPGGGERPCVQFGYVMRCGFALA